MASVSAKGIANAAPVPRAGQIAPNRCALFITLIGRLAGPCAVPCPLPHDAVLLTDVGFALEPQFHLRTRRQVAKIHLQRA